MQATESSLKALSAHAPHILHIATHGFYFTEKQVKRQNVLKFINTDAGLTAAETEDKALSRSGLLFAGANSVFGLQRGFKKAGAQSLIMSLWEVADEATQILMTSFYDNLLLGQSRHTAFHNAQQHLRAMDGGRFNHPQFWAAFVLLD